jgi:DNA polymerase-3 subunit alpha
MPNFVHLHTHSHYSLLDGMGKLPDLVSRAKELGMDTLALTDHGVMYGAVEFYKKCHDEGIKAIIGVETYVAPRTMADKEYKVDSSPFHLVLLAKNEAGYQNLLKIVTASFLQGYYYKPRVDKDFLRSHGEGIIALSACLAGEIPRLVGSNQKDRALEAIKEYQEIFGKENFYLELQYHPELPEQIKVNAELKLLAKELNIGLVCTNDIHYVRAEDKDAHEVLLAIQTGKDFDDENRLSLKEFDLSMTSPEDMAEHFKDVPEALANTVKIAAECNLELNLGQTILPKFETPNNETSEDYLNKLCYEGAEMRYGAITPEIKERLDYELEVILKCHFEDYFLIVRDYVKFAKDAGIVVGPGRGSAAGSIIAYVLEITDLDPIYYNLLFERFLNPERISPPDIDLDFADDRRAEVIQYISDKYGKDHVAQIITFGLMKARMVIRDVTRALGMSYADGDRIAKLIPTGMNLDESIASVAELKKIYDTEPPFRRLIDMAKRLENVARNAGTHAAGVVISQDDLTNFVPLQFPPRGENNIVTQYSMKYIDEVGLLKVDILGLSNLTIIKNALRIIKKTADVDLDLSKIPMDDAPSYELLARGDSSGVFQLESDGMKRYLKELKPTRFEDIISMVALYRPGPMDSIPDFIDAKHGRRKITYLDPKLEPILESTYGVIVTQDQVLQIARFFAGFTYGQADILRKAVGKKNKVMLDEQKHKFIDGAIKEGASHRTSQAVWDFIEPFAKYGFNRAHAACYAMISYQTAYLKAHFPSAFMAAWLTAEQNNIDKIAFAIGECQRMGIAVLPPNINESFLEFGVMKTSGDIRFGLAAIKNVGLGVSEKIVEERKNNGPYLSLGDFVSRLTVGRVLNKKVLEALAKTGALDQLAERNQIVSQIEYITKFMSGLDKSNKGNQMNLFAASDTVVPLAELKLEPVEAADQKQRLAWEKELLGIYISAHPLKEIAGRLSTFGFSIAELETLTGSNKIKAAGVITQSRKIMTKNKEPMMFITLEDLTGKIEVIVFPRTLAQDAAIWSSDEPIVVEGRIDRKENVTKIIAASAHKFEDEVTQNPGETAVTSDDPDAKKAIEKIVITIPRKAPKDILIKIKEILDQYDAGEERGLAVYLRVPQNGDFEEIKTKAKVLFKSSLTKELQEINQEGKIELL